MLESLKQALILVLVATFLISGVYSAVELQYLFRGRKAPADVLRSYVGPDITRRRNAKVCFVHVSFLEPDGDRREALVKTDRRSKIVEGDRVVVEAVPGSVWAPVRLASDRRVVPLILFSCGLIAACVLLVGLIRESRDPARKRRRRIPPPGPWRPARFH